MVNLGFQDLRFYWQSLYVDAGRWSAVHQYQANRVLTGIEQLFELVELSKHLQGPDNLKKCSAGVAGFHATNGVGSRANPLSQVLLRQATGSRKEEMTEIVIYSHF